MKGTKLKTLMGVLMTLSEKQPHITLFTPSDSSSSATAATSDQQLEEPEVTVANSSAVRAQPPVKERCISSFSSFVSRDNATKADTIVFENSYVALLVQLFITKYLINYFRGCFQLVTLSNSSNLVRQKVHMFYHSDVRHIFIRKHLYVLCTFI